MQTCVMPFDRLSPVLFFSSARFCFFFSLNSVRFSFVQSKKNVSFVDVLYTTFFSAGIFGVVLLAMLLAFLSTKFHLCQFSDCQYQYVMCLFVNHS